jgi:hypothetical protein
MPLSFGTTHFAGTTVLAVNVVHAVLFTVFASVKGALTNTDAASMNVPVLDGVTATSTGAVCPGAGHPTPRSVSSRLIEPPPIPPAPRSTSQSREQRRTTLRATVAHAECLPRPSTERPSSGDSLSRHVYNFGVPERAPLWRVEDGALGRSLGD